MDGEGEASTGDYDSQHTCCQRSPLVLGTQGLIYAVCPGLGIPSLLNRP